MIYVDFYLFYNSGEDTYPKTRSYRRILLKFYSPDYNG